MSELKINLLEFRKQMDLLEGIGLMKSFVKHDEQLSSFVYQLVQPPSAKQFFNDPMLSVYLYSEVSKQRLPSIKAVFRSRTYCSNATLSRGHANILQMYLKYLIIKLKWIRVKFRTTNIIMASSFQM
ncbi:chromosome replication initiation membrane attachment protein [Staphylococcus gallinarum]|uniref:Chromosome replication initiation membrane attachment protein n=1 Tax=Staphylococcus gallinarum TaxID=1293 RepID=A0A380FIQ0_STAGA|nr:chromosome replication initiation membrane attachment protein [Staphylococcus gallinarum]